MIRFPAWGCRTAFYSRCIPITAGSLEGSGCDTISSTHPLNEIQYELRSIPILPVALSRLKSLHDYGRQDTELVIHDALGREVHRHRYPPHATSTPGYHPTYRMGLYPAVVFRSADGGDEPRGGDEGGELYTP